MTKLEAYLNSLTRSQRNIVVGVSWSGDIIDPCFNVVYAGATDSLDPEWSFHVREQLERSGASHFFLSHGYTRKSEDFDEHGYTFERTEVIPHDGVTFLGVIELNHTDWKELPDFLTSIEKYV